MQKQAGSIGLPTRLLLSYPGGIIDRTDNLVTDWRFSASWPT